ncbi:M14 family zinc carboxypeptidase [Pseudoalteromonas sp. OOF1S-7]|uniref:M14 family zinc carboxypeptidase n=1 Tax=Pseudoalteromonas sp. OOF1S-7 TaxID=2917757 RepID=UPI001EF612F7|nr:M14 family zinc carboxypeptidase [Pseudoalteromonas sp. OOF1S-7]MCG7534305.1 PKD domain-containing protein [Pseudoalteromonas sp. OOF1S-7]
MKRNVLGTLLLSAISLSATAHSPSEITSSQPLAVSEHTLSTYQLAFASEAQKVEYLTRYHDALLDVKDNYLVLTLNQAEFAELHEAGALIFLTTRARTFPDTRSLADMPMQGRNQSASPESGIPNFPCYPTLTETHQMAQALAQTYPDFVELKHIGPSWEKSQGLGGHDLTVLVLKNKKKNKWRKRPALYMQGALHAREYTPGATTLKFAKYLLENRETNADINWIMDQREIHILLIANPDGRVLAEQGQLWRKNTNTAYCALDDTLRGVDLNRNFDFAWASPIGGSTDDQCAATYHGPSAASEPETQAIQAYLHGLFKDRRGDLLTDPAPLNTQGVFLDLHSFSRFVMWPWSSELTPSPNAQQLSMMGHRMAAYNGYTAFQTKEVFRTGGSADGYVYGQLGVASFTFELGNSFFESCANYEGEIFPNNLNALIYAAKVAKRPYKMPAGPQINDLRIQGAGDEAIPAGTPVQIIADVADDLFGRSLIGQLPPSEAIRKVELIIKRKGKRVKQRILLPAADGVFDTVSESINYTLDTHRWRKGRYTLTLRAQDASGQWGPKYAKFLTIDNDAMPGNVAPVADYTADCRKGICGFDGSVTQDDRDALTYRWVLAGDRFLGVFHGEQVEIEYGLAGNYQLTLTVDDSHGYRDTKTVQLELDGVRPPVAQFSYQCTGLTCEFDSSASYDPDGDIVQRLWRMGLSAPYLPGAEKAVHTFPAPGEYTIAFVVIDNDNEFNETWQTITITETK